jgi:hypothetical protein
MSVLKRPAALLTSVALAVTVTLALALAAGSASAAAPKPKTWTISHGGAVKLAAKGFTLTDVTAKLSLPCKASAAKAKLKVGKKLSGTAAGTVTAASTSGCVTDGFAIKITAGHLPWHLNLVSYNAAKGVTTATLTGIHISMSVPAIGCTAVADGTKGNANNGSLAVTYTNKTAKLTVLKTGGKLHLYDIHSCLGLIKNGDTVAIAATYAVSPAQKITSP